MPLMSREIGARSAPVEVTIQSDLRRIPAANGDKIDGKKGKTNTLVTSCGRVVDDWSNCLVLD